MIDHINALYLCWYISPPWGYRIPSVEVNLLERAYVCATRTFGYCCGIEWKQDRWIYAIASGHEIIHATKYQIIGTGWLQVINFKKPAFLLGERVMFRFHSNGTKQRLILGIRLVHTSWFYLVELVSPTFPQAPTTPNRFSLVKEEDLVRVNV